MLINRYSELRSSLAGRKCSAARKATGLSIAKQLFASLCSSAHFQIKLNFIVIAGLLLRDSTGTAARAPGAAASQQPALTLQRVTICFGIECKCVFPHLLQGEHTALLSLLIFRVFVRYSHL